MNEKCDEIRPLIERYADNELDVPQAERVRRHVDECAGCRRELAEIQQLQELVRQAAPPAPAEEYWALHRHRVWKGIRAGGRHRQEPYRRSSFLGMKLATLAGAAIVLLVVVIAGWRMAGERWTLPSQQPGAPKVPVTVVEQGARTAEQPAPVVSEAPPTVAASGAGRQEQAAADKTTRTGAAPADQAHAAAVIAAGGTARGASASTPSGKKEAPPAAQSLNELLAAGRGDQVKLGSGAELKAAGKPSREIVAQDTGPGAPVMLTSRELSGAGVSDSGTAIVRVVTDSAGSVLQVLLRRSSGVVKLDSIALAVARMSRFSPAVRSGKAVRGLFDVPYRFKAAKKPQRESGR